MGAAGPDQSAKRVLRAAHQNALLMVLAVSFGFAGFLYAAAHIELWIVAGFLIAAAVANVVRVVRTNRRMTRL
jgi:uncharacterized membrane protein